MKKKVGVIGSSEVEKEGLKKAKTIGAEIAKNKCNLLTGGCTGIPYAAVKGAKEGEGTTIGISPASNEKEHIEKYGYPVENHDLIIYTGFGLKGRNVILIRSCDAVIAVSGGFGTLNELTIAHAEGKIIGLLKNVPGISAEFERLTKKINESKEKIISSENPKELAKKVIKKI